MLIPVAEADGAQYLTLLQKSADAELVSEKILRVRFVPLAGKNH
jgi:protein-L-isoaspartate O-methyltransferase